MIRPVKLAPSVKPDDHAQKRTTNLSVFTGKQTYAQAHIRASGLDSTQVSLSYLIVQL